MNSEAASVAIGWVDDGGGEPECVTKWTDIGEGERARISASIGDYRRFVERVGVVLGLVYGGVALVFVCLVGLVTGWYPVDPGSAAALFVFAFLYSLPLRRESVPPIIVGLEIEGAPKGGGDE